MSSEVSVTAQPALPRGLIILLGLAAALGAALGMREFSNILGPVFLALVLSITVHPVRRMADRHRWPAWVGIILSLLAVYGIVAGLFFILIISGIQFAALLQDYAPQFQALLGQATAFLESLGISQEQLQKMVSELSPGRLVGLASSVLGGIAGVLSNAVFLIVLLFFTVADADLLPQSWKASCRAESGSPRHLGSSLMAPANIWR